MSAHHDTWISFLEHAPPELGVIMWLLGSMKLSGSDEDHFQVKVC